MDQISISLNEVSETASRIRQLNQMMYDALSEMKKEMNLLSGTWISEGSEEIRSRFAMFAGRFDRQKTVIDEYARFLELTVSSYDSLESAITGNASGIQY
ncbi:MAG: pore-forming ESAT-6 family protein [Solobacterium sp.]|nr:pore-forming ESAT-6 family protein [Solobacterium sp.]